MRRSARARTYDADPMRRGYEDISVNDLDVFPSVELVCPFDSSRSVGQSEPVGQSVGPSESVISRHARAKKKEWQ